MRATETAPPYVLVMKSPATRSAFSALLLVAVVFGVRGFCPGHEEACTGEIKIIENAENRGLNVQSLPNPHCDYRLDGWYQFKHTDGTVLSIPEQDHGCQKSGTCGTELPITLRRKETRHDVTLYDGCLDYFSCCLFKTKVCSKNCDKGIIYYLSSPFGCPVAYCTYINAGSLCSKNQHRDPDGKCVDKFPQNLSKNPEISVNVDKLKETVEFTCSVFFDQITTGGKEKYKVQWMKDGEHMPGLDETISYTETVQKFVITFRHLFPSLEEFTSAFTLTCKVQSFYDGKDERSKWFSSRGFFVGLSVHPSSIEIDKTELREVKIDVRPTFPIVCPQLQNKPCRVVVQVQHEDDMERVQKECRHSFSADNWESTHSFTLKPVPKILNNGLNYPRKIFISLYKYITDFTTPIEWSHYKPTPITVNLRNAQAKVCKSYGDPHFVTFDEKSIDYYGLGDFLLATSRLNNLQVHIRLWKCKNRFTDVSCTCGIAIREGNDVVSVGRCLGSGDNGLLQVVRNSKNAFSRGFRVFRKSDTVRVILPSGSFADIRRRDFGMDVSLRLSPIYSAKTKGICGNYNDISSDDLTGKDDKEYQESDETGFAYHFTETWRVEEKYRLFEKDDLDYENDAAEITNILKFCKCEEGPLCTENEINTIKSVMGPLWDSGFTQIGAVAAATNSRRKKRAAVEELAVAQLDIPRYSWPTKSNITEEMAKEKCQNDLSQTSVLKACKEEGFVRDIDSAIIRACVEDIKVTDDLDWPLYYVQAVQSQCEDAILENSSYWREKQSPQNQSVSVEESPTEVLPVFPKAVLNSFCPNNCSGIGTCVDSKCVCPNGFAGEECAVDLAEPPHASHFNYGPFCDVNEQPCTTLHVIGSGFYNHPSLTCVIKVQGSRRILKIKAKYQSMIDLTCRIPNNIFRQNGTTHVPLTVKVAVGGSISDEELRYTVHNATCYECNEDANCFLKSGMCNIKGKCIGKNDFIELRGHCQTCEPAYSTSKWKITRKKELCPTLTEPQNGFVKVFSFGSHLTANYSCTERGFVLAGERSRTCNLTNACNRHVHWSGNPPLCIKYDPCNDFYISAGLLNFSKQSGCKRFTVEDCITAARGLVQVLLLCDDKIVKNNYEYTHKPNYKSKWTLVKSTWYFNF